MPHKNFKLYQHAKPRLYRTLTSTLMPWHCVLQAETSRELAAVTYAEAEALAAAASRQMQAEQASSKEVQRLREESAELRE